MRAIGRLIQPVQKYFCRNHLLQLGVLVRLFAWPHVKYVSSGVIAVFAFCWCMHTMDGKSEGICISCLVCVIDGYAAYVEKAFCLSGYAECTAPQSTSCKGQWMWSAEAFTYRCIYIIYLSHCKTHVCVHRWLSDV